MEKFMKMIDSLAENGWAKSDNFLEPDIVHALLKEQKELYEAGLFRKAGIGKGESFQIRPEIRGDYVMWLNQDNLTELQKHYIDKVNEFRMLINQELYVGLNDFECHFTVYPPGSFYKKHVDQFKQVSYRIISCILYLNEDWTENDGGTLRIYKENDPAEVIADVVPKMNTFVCFKSDTIYHEVLPTERERCSITGWLRR